MTTYETDQMIIEVSDEELKLHKESTDEIRTIYVNNEEFEVSSIYEMKWILIDNKFTFTVIDSYDQIYCIGEWMDEKYIPVSIHRTDFVTSNKLTLEELTDKIYYGK